MSKPKLLLRKYRVTETQDIIVKKLTKPTNKSSSELVRIAIDQLINSDHYQQIINTNELFKNFKL